MSATMPFYGQPVPMTAKDVRRAEIRKLIIETSKTITSLQRSLNRLEAELNDSAA